MRIDAIDPDTAGAADLDAWHEFCVATDRFDYPGEPDPPRASTVGGLIAGEDRRLTWFARSGGDGGGEIVGGITLMLTGYENTHYAEFDVRVRPADRRAGIGRALFERARAAAVADGRTEFETWAQAGGPGAAFVEAMGMRPALEEIRRVLRVSDVDVEAVAELAAGAASRPDGFDLVRWIDHCPDEWLEAYAAAIDGMNDVPLGDIDWRPVTTTGKRVRMLEDAAVRRGSRRHVVAVRERSTGAIAGFTQVFVSPDTPRAAQEETTVLGPYRGRGFGLWLKADMLRWLSEVEPRVSEYQTWNAAENRHMIAVNERLGYHVVDPWQAWKLVLG
ncbi:MAG TPA: GNAT family N-acetyltransferase [Mycobacteriales bacterium]|nr:GNAT family N-acetyltransferase [Mycobacteriales bacterium]